VVTLLWIVAWLTAAMPSTPPESAPLRVAVISDLNSGYGSKRYAPAVHAATKALVERVRPDLVLITGDMVAGQKSGLDYRGMWKAFHASVTDPLLAADIPVAPAPGNHDAAPGFAAERRHYFAQWTDPKRAARVRYVDASSYPFHYSFEHAGVFFAAIDATAVGRLRAAGRDEGRGQDRVRSPPAASDRAAPRTRDRR
jgi:3',5'-cyclic AMP phosphodiesterase CpdA